MLAATPALPVRDVPSAVAFHCERLGVDSRHVDGELGIMGRDEIELHLWEANTPHTLGAEPHLAGSASRRVQVEGVHALYDEYRKRGVIHPNGALALQPWGSRISRFSTRMATRSPSSSQPLLASDSASIQRGVSLLDHGGIQVGKHRVQATAVRSRRRFAARCQDAG